MLTHQALGFSIRTPLLPLLLFFPSSSFSSLFSFTFLFYKAIDEHYHVHPLTLQDYLADNLAKGFIQASTSPSEVPILFVKKKDSTLQLCVNY